MPGVFTESAEALGIEKSIAAFPAPEAFAAMMTEAGLEDVTVRRFNFGGTSSYVGRVAR